MKTEDAFETWEELKTFYNERFGVERSLVDLAAVYDMLHMCAAGSSNKAIAGFLRETETAVSEIIDAYLGFMGWEYDLVFNPKRVYDNLEIKDIESFKDKVVTTYGAENESVLNNAYDVAVLVSRLEKLLNEKWI